MYQTDHHIEIKHIVSNWPTFTISQTCLHINHHQTDQPLPFSTHPSYSPTLPSPQNHHQTDQPLPCPKHAFTLTYPCPFSQNLHQTDRPPPFPTHPCTLIYPFHYPKTLPGLNITTNTHKHTHTHTMTCCGFMAWNAHGMFDSMVHVMLRFMSCWSIDMSDIHGMFAVVDCVLAWNTHGMFQLVQTRFMYSHEWHPWHGRPMASFQSCHVVTAYYCSKLRGHSFQSLLLSAQFAWPVCLSDVGHDALDMCVFLMTFVHRHMLHSLEGSNATIIPWHVIASWMALHGIAWHCMALHGIAWHCMALHGIAWHCMALHGIAWHCMALWHCNLFLGV